MQQIFMYTFNILNLLEYRININVTYTMLILRTSPRAHILQIKGDNVSLMEIIEHAAISSIWKPVYYNESLLNEAK